MVNNQGVNFPVEEIPDSDELYRLIHISYIRAENTPEGDIPRGAFRDSDGTGISTDWSRYSTPDEALGRKDPDENGLIEMNVGVVRGIRSLSVVHTPKNDNRAHTSIFGLYKNPRKEKIRILLIRASRWIIPP